MSENKSFSEKKRPEPYTFQLSPLSGRHPLVTFFFLPTHRTSHHLNPDNRVLSAIELWMTDTVSLQWGPITTLSSRPLARSRLIPSLPYFQAVFIYVTLRFLLIDTPCHYYPDPHLLYAS